MLDPPTLAPDLRTPSWGSPLVDGGGASQGWGYSSSSRLLGSKYDRLWPGFAFPLARWSLGAVATGQRWFWPLSACRPLLARAGTIALRIFGAAAASGPARVGALGRSPTRLALPWCRPHVVPEMEFVT
ncbi:hypothetical protein PVAP13_4KG241110 [Panicum virgatum]|uniref:Uncharacterized protein n=1 Tax=Panicum virgatum TaxID=38727 RepID=A0A8T0TTG8_PANVG|nr:hypothetical protein PVAP13_4KG241110 [Panicum virgatum]